MHTPASREDTVLCVSTPRLDMRRQPKQDVRSNWAVWQSGLMQAEEPELKASCPTRVIIAVSRQIIMPESMVTPRRQEFGGREETQRVAVGPLRRGSSKGVTDPYVCNSGHQLSLHPQQTRRSTVSEADRLQLTYALPVAIAIKRVSVSL